MTEQLTRNNYIESEFAKWEESYEIGFEQEFDIKAMLGLQYQFMKTPKEHVKTLGDIIHTKNQILRNLNLKPKIKLSNDQKRDYLFIIDNDDQKIFLEELFANLTNIQKLHSSRTITSIQTDQFKVKVIKNNENELRGRRADVVLKVDEGYDLIKPRLPRRG